MTYDPLVGDDDDKLYLVFFFNQRVRKSVSPLLNFFEAVFFVLSTVGIGTSNVEPIQQQLSDEHLLWK